MILSNIVFLCQKAGISIAKLEKETGIGNGTIGRWDKSSPTVDKVKRVAEYFGMSVDELISNTVTTDTSAS